MRIVGCEDRKDLRTVTAKSVYLKKVARECHLKNNEAFCFTNKAMTRFRLVYKINKALFMCVPEIDEQSKYSVYLKISEQLAAFAGIKSVVKFDVFTAVAKARIKRQKGRKKAAARKAKKVKKRLPKSKRK